MKAALTKLSFSIVGMHDDIHGNVSRISGDVSNIYGNVTGISGDVSNIYGDMSGIRGDLDACEITPEERAAGIYIKNLIST